MLDPESGTVDYVNAGHNPPFLVTAEEITPLGEGGLILGVMPTTIPYDVGHVEMKEGDSLVIYTDGVSEAMNTQRDEYGEERLADLLRKQYRLTADTIFNEVRDDVTAHVGEAPQSDDITVIVLVREND